MERKFYEEVVAAMATEGYEVVESSTLTVNMVKRGLQLRNMNSEETAHIGADVSFDEYFTLWKREGVGTVVRQLLGVVNESALSEPDETQRILASAAGIREKETLLQGVFLQLINTERNQELLREVPHRAFYDLSVIYRYKVVDMDGRLGSIIIKHGFLPEGVTEELLYEAACKNTWEMFPYVVKNMEDFVGFPAPGMLVLTNQSGLNGANVLLNQNALQEGVARLGSKKVWILPSSLHELVLISYDEYSYGNALLDMVYCINHTQLEPQEFLSDNIYVFDAVARSIEMVTADSCMLAG